MDILTKVRQLKGIGEKAEADLRKLNIETVGDLLRHYPHDYDIPVPVSRLADCRPGETVAVYARIAGNVTVRNAKGKSLCVCQIADATGSCHAIWFRMPYLKSTLRAGMWRVFRGKLSTASGRRELIQPELFEQEAYDELSKGLLPKYLLAGSLRQKQLRGAIRSVLEGLPVQTDYLPEEIIRANELTDYDTALRKIHFPESHEAMTAARRRLIFDEFFLYLCRIRLLRRDAIRQPNGFPIRSSQYVDKILKVLPYALTGAQKRVLSEIMRDLNGEWRTSRLVQGDVGSGKTILAVLALALVAENGYQGLLMAPTEVLATQHYETLTRLLKKANLPIGTALLTGSLSVSEKKEVHRRIRSHEAAIIVGTHALIQEKALYDNPALVITDEQHRFGVRQREGLSLKGSLPHMLVMSATPIPRTLAMILYGDMDVSVVDERPHGRLPIGSCILTPGERAKAWRFIVRQLKEGRQAYIICPMVEDSESITGENVMDYYEQVREAFPPEVRTDYLHGRMRPEEKNLRMRRFLEHETDLLISTTVVEVGVDVPNATVMMIENAERFGLAQLHQLRGRVGRGKHASYCIFINASDKKEAAERLAVVNNSDDGFVIAEKDLQLRGPGDIRGIRQSGELPFLLGDVFSDASLLHAAAAAASSVFAEDSELGLEKNAGLRRELEMKAYGESMSIYL